MLTPQNPQYQTPQHQIVVYPSTHQLVAGQATPLVVGATLAEGVTVSGISELLIQAGSGAQINGNPVEGSLSVCAGDRLTTPAVEILLIAVAS